MEKRRSTPARRLPNGEPILYIALLGSLELTYDGEPVRFAAPPLTAALLVHLLLPPGKRYSRSMFAGALWPQVPRGRALTNVRRHLFYLRNALPAPRRTPWLLFEGKDVAWNTAAPARVDATLFERLCERRHRREEALGLYRGDLYPLSHAPWIAAERERLRALHVRTLERGMNDAILLKDWLSVTRLASRLCRAQPWNERPVRALIDASIRLGDHRAALRAFGDCVSALRLQDASPSPATLRLVLPLTGLRDSHAGSQADEGN